MNNSENNKRIAKNAMFLYFRMFLTLGISLYTVRLVLEILGVVDFGIYNVVGGIVLMMEFLKSSMSESVQRFLSYELGKKNYTQLSKVFSMSINIYVLIALFVFILAETLGLWFLNTKMIIPIDRIIAANWVYQFSIFTFIVGLLNVSYNAVIISAERMKIYFYISILETILKLVIVFFLSWIEFDKLIIYSGLLFTLSVVIFTLSVFYCAVNFPAARYIFSLDKKLFKTLLNYSGWSLFGGLAGVTKGQGVNILLNLFFGPVINAARGVAFLVQGSVNMLLANLQVAIGPQIVKSFASNDLKYMHQLIYQGSKFSFLLIYIISLPILLETELILKMWLVNVPDNAVIFTRLAIINVLIDSVSGTLMTGAHASGKIKKYQLVVGGLQILILPVSYLFLVMQFPPQITFYISIVISILALFARLSILTPLISISTNIFIKQVLFKITPVILLSSIISFMVLLNFNEGLIRFLIVTITSIFLTITSTYKLSLNQQEKLIVLNQINRLKNLGFKRN